MNIGQEAGPERIRLHGDCTKLSCLVIWPLKVAVTTLRCHYAFDVTYCNQVIHSRSLRSAQYRMRVPSLGHPVIYRFFSLRGLDDLMTGASPNDSMTAKPNDEETMDETILTELSAWRGLTIDTCQAKIASSDCRSSTEAMKSCLG